MLFEIETVIFSYYRTTICAKNGAEHIQNQEHNKTSNIVLTNMYMAGRTCSLAVNIQKIHYGSLSSFTLGYL